MLENTIKKGGLGRNLSALLSQTTSAKEIVADNQDNNDNKITWKQLSIEQLVSGKYQPRKQFPEESLQELASSIQQHGILQPIVVRNIGYEQYEIIGGERRWRAAKLAQLKEVPVLIYIVSDQQALALALIENIQREDLSPMEKAYGLHRLIEEFGFTHQQTAEALGQSRTNVTNMLRLLNLSTTVKQWLEEKKLEMGHARALLMLPPDEQHQVAQIVMAKNLSVRETEQLVKKYRQSPEKEKASTLEKTKLDPNIMDFQKQLSKRLGTKVEINHNTKGVGRLVIHYNNLGELDGIIDHMA